MASFAESERREQIISLLGASGRVTIGELTTRFGISAVTARKDLEVLERHRLVDRVRGGAVLARTTDEDDFEARLSSQVAAKRAIAAVAASRVRAGVLDASTTCYYLAERLAALDGLIVLTNSLKAAEVLGAAGRASVVVPGGTLRPRSWSTVGDFGGDLAANGRYAHGFFSTPAAAAGFGMMEFSADEAAAKRQLVNACEQVHGLMDATKAGNFAAHSIVPAARVTELITDEAMSSARLAQWEAVGVVVQRVRVPVENPSAAIRVGSGFSTVP